MRQGEGRSAPGVALEKGVTRNFADSTAEAGMPANKTSAQTQIGILVAGARMLRFVYSIRNEKPRKDAGLFLRATIGTLNYRSAFAASIAAAMSGSSVISGTTWM